jgi:hypothetical protein
LNSSVEFGLLYHTHTGLGMETVLGTDGTGGSLALSGTGRLLLSVTKRRLTSSQLPVRNQRRLETEAGAITGEWWCAVFSTLVLHSSGPFQFEIMCKIIIKAS